MERWVIRELHAERTVCARGAEIDACEKQRVVNGYDPAT